MFRFLMAFMLFTTACAAEPESHSAPPPTPEPAREGSLVVIPAAAEVGLEEGYIFRAYVTGPTDPGTVWKIREGAAGGWITQGGYYSAPMTAGEYHLDVHSTAFTDMTTTVTIRVRPRLAWPRVVNPNPGQSVQIKPFMRAAGGELQPVPDPVFRVLEGDGGGTVTSDGTYTAPGKPGTYRIEVSSATHRIFAGLITASVPPRPVWMTRITAPRVHMTGVAATADGHTLAYGTDGALALFGEDGEPYRSWKMTDADWTQIHGHHENADGMMLLLGNETPDTLVSLDRQWNIRWTSRIPYTFLGVSMTTAENTAFVSSSCNWQYCYDSIFGELNGSGSLLWARRLSLTYQSVMESDDQFVLVDPNGISVSTFARDGSPLKQKSFKGREIPGYYSRASRVGGGAAVYSDKGMDPLSMALLTGDGEMAWWVEFLVNGQPVRGRIEAVDQTPEGDIVATGTLMEEVWVKHYYSKWIARIASDGTVLWARRFGVEFPYADHSLSLAVDDVGLIHFSYRDWSGLNLVGRIPPDGWLAIPGDAEVDMVPLTLSTRPIEWEQQDWGLPYVWNAYFTSVTDDALTITSFTPDYVRIAP